VQIKVDDDRIGAFDCVPKEHIGDHLFDLRHVVTVEFLAY
jgi:hypothetical protein